ncbi:hypothetical protein IV203_002056 [Nitzschia inconspicua]|uniref:Uncharacterized protein n=1 Tax=Nitzschia inconspicua TaxID=303405 RepID=A0A9K3L8J0_9STRA|nr:hypothetical protein IV203_002056 [Nitzschia inconspicua]
MMDDGIVETSKPTTPAEERDRVFRIARCAVLMLFFWLIILWLLYERDNKLVIILISLFSAVVLYFLGLLCSVVLMSPSSSTPPDIEDGGESYEMTEQNEHHSILIASSCNRGGDVDESSTGGVFSYPFGETRRRIRNCQDFASSHNAPKDGTYRIVCTAIIFGKQIRSEGYLHLTFLASSKDPSKNTGWEVEGSCIFGKRQSTIQEGFVNAKGHIYWVLPLQIAPKHGVRTTNDDELTNVTVYRGKWDPHNVQSWEDGEFQSLQEVVTTTTTRSGGSHEGRIVRLELQQAAATTSDSDMNCSTNENNLDTNIRNDLELV